MLSENKKKFVIDKKAQEQELIKETNSNITGSQFKRSILIAKD